MPRLKRTRNRSELTAGVKLYLSTPDMEGVFGSGKWALLRAIRDTGSIQSAARVLGRSYRKAWGDIKRAEEGLGRSLVMRRRGGQEHGSTVLTEYGEALLDAWSAYRKAVQTQTDRAFEKYMRPLVDSRSSQAANATNNPRGETHAGEHQRKR